MTTITYQIATCGCTTRFTMDSKDVSIETMGKVLFEHKLYMSNKQLQKLVDTGNGAIFERIHGKWVAMVVVSDITDKVKFEKALDIVINSKRYRESFYTGKISIDTFISICLKANKLADQYELHRPFN